MTPEHALFILGNFNMTENPSTDKSSANKRIDPSLQNLKSLKHTLHVEDIWRIKHPNKTQKRMDPAYEQRQLALMKPQPTEVTITQQIPAAEEKYQPPCSA